ncbi:MAG: PDZ domain-containing protein [Myxococcota bacterium]
MIPDRETLFELAERLEGIPVLGCLPGSRAQRAGILYGDILLEIDGRRVKSLDDVFDRRGDEETRRVTVFRNGDTLEIVLDAAPDG